MAKNQNILLPQYVQKFQCIGGECEDNCCIGWNVHIDKDTYKLYRNCPDAELRKKLDKAVTRVRVNSSNRIYAKVKMIASICPFLDKEKFCSIQRMMGEKYLSNICSVYPRNYNLVNGILEKSLVLSCPEAARLALLNTDVMQFDIAEEDSHMCELAHNALNNTLDTAEAEKKHQPEQYFSELRIFTISLLQNRIYPLWQRLVILGLFCNSLNKLIVEHKTKEILPLITTYLKYLKEDVFHDRLESIPKKLGVQIAIIKELVAKRNVVGKNARFRECFFETIQGMKYADNLHEEVLANQYDFAYQNYYQPFASEHEYILENYLVDYVFKTLFPFRREKNVFDNYVALIVQYSTIKMLLIGMAGFHEEKFNTEHALKLIQSFAKVTTHNIQYLKSVIDFLKNNNMNTLPYMSILIKN